MKSYWAGLNAAPPFKQGVVRSVDPRMKTKGGGSVDVNEDEKR